MDGLRAWCLVYLGAFVGALFAFPPRCVNFRAHKYFRIGPYVCWWITMIKGKTSSTGLDDGIKYIEIPRGWKRILENDSIQYIRFVFNKIQTVNSILSILNSQVTHLTLVLIFLLHRCTVVLVQRINTPATDVFENIIVKPKTKRLSGILCVYKFYLFCFRKFLFLET